MEKHGYETGGGGGGGLGGGGAAGVGGRGGGVGGGGAAAVFYARPNSPERRTRFPDGFTGTLALQNPARLNEQATATVLQRLHALEAWRYAQQARTLHRLHKHVRDACTAPGASGAGASGAGASDAGARTDHSQVFSLTATEVQTLLCLSYQAAARLLADALDLCTGFAATLAALEAGTLSCRQAATILDQCRFLDGAEQSRFEAELLASAPGHTDAQFTRSAVGLRERLHPETLIPRHRKALEARKVWFEARPDGMAELGAYLAAEQGQLIYGALTTAARGEQAAGDPRSVGQLRADILTSLLTGAPGTVHEAPDGQTPQAPLRRPAGNDRPVSEPAPHGTGAGAGASTGNGAGAGAGAGAGTQTEIMVLVNADTLLGLNDAPAELNGYGPISAETARRLAENASHLTGLVQDRASGEILGVGKRRRIPPGLRRWLQARDGTCRFPGCDTPAAGHTTTEIDHTLPWANGGPTDHTNLSHLCRKHHRFKTLGHWKAHQSTSGPSSGILEWTSPLGRTYQTTPQLRLRVTGHQPPDLRAEPPPRDQPSPRETSPPYEKPPFHEKPPRETPPPF
ncbi:HNH endonuclease [Arthrobacter sp. zg-Y826]|uniref:HNH endonuclease n=1 Tax=Arthrobacter jinronghuae TaxID=2964609 RepID=UPI002107CD39|nr:HNH endonuclease signature motif containing protein [Arthrobacter jinronghuae]MCQ1958081.1 HNH endonuclease [Arthrobacter jinronghuae]